MVSLLWLSSLSVAYLCHPCHLEPVTGAAAFQGPFALLGPCRTEASRSGRCAGARPPSRTRRASGCTAVGPRKPRLGLRGRGEAGAGWPR
ncbi:hypothetical protein I79_026138 [Cricetulus griseus]|nr:hypothetical protein I79_026138 [Cricetulus griseus]